MHNIKKNNSLNETMIFILTTIITQANPITTQAKAINIIRYSITYQY